ncbi:outer membrane lipoprotein carrier protein LolA [Nevskia sp.]|uniref:outer membrane lipoprotein carrier protein LolA n=1 Tax=Nevskia sp. TaxID=1929292 RepID=UPI0025FFA3B2|nr:outer membrane lipoprotein carrier protein LolA [Nevskia sp.]
MIRARLASLLIALLLPLSVHAATTVAELHSLLAKSLAGMQQAKSLHGDFTQTRQLSGFPQPLVSHGDFLFLRRIGIAWRSREPIQSEFILDGSGVHGSGGLIPQNANQSSLRPIAALFIAMFELDLDALAERFELNASGSVDAWQLDLVPRDEALKALTPHLSLHGGAQIERVSFADSLGDLTEIRFERLRASSELPTTDERARFAK